jgi:tetratricopeptide (TPR) repeat protein
MTSILDELIKKAALAQAAGTEATKGVFLEFSEEDLKRLADPLGAIPNTERVALRNLATARTFDKDLAEQYLLKELSVPVAFEDLLATSYVEMISERDGRYRVARSLRDALFRTWWPDDASMASYTNIPQALRELSGHLAAAYLERGDELEQIYHLIVGDPEEAYSLFSLRFDEADAAFDLPRCHALVLTLEERRSLLDPKLASLLEAKSLRLEARTMWSQEYYATMSYFERTATRNLIPELIEGKDRWILHLHALGGMGKTMFIQAALARYCVPRGIPCARIDFDFVTHISEAAREPWRLLLRVADQLNHQLPGRPFDELLAEYALYVAETTARRKVRVQDPMPVPPGDLGRIRQDIVSRFLSTLEEIWHNEPYLLVFDTIEELRLRNVNLEEAFQLLADLRSGSPGLRVILAGRYNLHENESGTASRSTGFMQRFSGQERTVELQPFDDNEARAYLQQQRGMTDDARLSAIIAKGQGNPLKLALLADIARDNPELSSQEIEDYAAVDLVYLIERVVDRIKDEQVRWLLRYGVVPHQLTLDFVEKVMVPYLQRGLKGDTSLDDPSSDNLPEQVKARKPFATDPTAAPIDAQALWQGLAQYVSRASWVFPSPGTPASLTFHSEVREPMRYLLREQQHQQRIIYEALNQKAVYYFERLAITDPADRARWLGEAVYHQFQAGRPEVAAAYWKRQLDAASDDPRMAIILSEQVLNLAGGLGRRQPLDRIVGPAISNETKALAAYELARHALASEVPLTETDRLRVKSLLDMAQSLNSEDGGVGVVPDARLAQIRGCLELADGKAVAALNTCLQALQQPADSRNEMELRLLASNSLEVLGRKSESVQHSRLALKLAETLDQRSISRARLQLARNLQSVEAYLEAAKIYRQLQSEALESSDFDRAAQYVVEIIRANVALGREAGAVREGEIALAALQDASGRAVPYGPFPSSRWRSVLRAELALALLSLRSALGELDGPEPLNAPRATDLQSSDKLGAIEIDLRARIAIKGLDVKQAIACYERLAWDIYGPGTEAGLRCLLACADIFINLVPDSGQAARYLAAIKESEQHIGDGAGTSWSAARRLLEVQFLTLQGHHDEAAQLLASLDKEADPNWPPSLRVRIAMEGLIQRRMDTRSPKKLRAVLQTVRPASRRLVLLEELNRFHVDGTPAPEALRDLPKLLSTGAGTGQDPMLAALRLAEVLRVAGRVQEARELLRQPEQAGLNSSRLALLRRVYLLHDSLGWPKGALADVKLPADDDLAWKESPALSGVLLLEHAERLAKVEGNVTEAAVLLDRAAELLNDPSSMWSARIASLSGAVTLALHDYKASEGAWRRAGEAFKATGCQPGAIAAAERAVVASTYCYGPAHQAVTWDTTNLVALRYYLDEKAGIKLAIESATIVAQPFNLAVAANKFGRMLYTQGNLEEARVAFQQAVQRAEPDSSYLPGYLSDLGFLLYLQGDYKEARQLYERALAIQERVLGPEHPSMAGVLSNLAAVLYDQSEYENARSLWERTLAIQEKALGPNHSDTAQTLNSLGAVLRVQGNYKEARQLYERALAIQERVLGPEHPSVAGVLSNLATISYDQGEYEDARSLWTRTLAIQEKVLGPDHPNTAQTLNNLAFALQAQGNYVEARQLYERALAIQERVFGPEHPSVAGVLSNLAAVLYDQGEYENARSLWTRTLAIREKALGPDHPDTAQTLNNLAIALQAQGNYVEARQLYEKALAIHERTLGLNNPDAIRFLQNLAGLLGLLGDSSGAQLQYERASSLAASANEAALSHPEHTQEQATQITIQLEQLPDARLLMATSAYIRGRRVVLHDQELVLPHEVTRFLHTDYAEGVNNAFVHDFAQDWALLSAKLGDVLFSGLAAAGYSGEDRPFGLCWKIADEQLAGLPLEMLRLGPHGMPLALTRACRYLLREPAHSMGTRAGVPGANTLPSVLILRAGSAGGAKYIRSASAWFGPDLSELYEHNGIRLTEITAWRPNIMREGLLRLPPRIVHIVASIRGRGSRLLLDFGASVGDLASILLDSRTKPLVILDVPAPPGTSERVRQLCLRNTFAAQLAEKSSLDVLATGLGDPRQQTRLLDTLVWGLGHEWPIVEIARSITQLATEVHPLDAWANSEPPPSLESVLPFLGTALFVNDTARAVSQVIGEPFERGLRPPY